MRNIVKLIVITLVFFAQLVSAQAGPKVITWDDLLPNFYSGIKMNIPKNDAVRGVPTAEKMQVTKDELKEILGDIEFMKEMQPQGAKLNPKMNGINVRIPGYATPVGFDGENITEFLLVPYLGACTHVPPPPANQIVYVKNAKGLKIEDMWEPIWLTGKISAKSVSTVLADVGYSLENGLVEPYEAYPENVREAH